MVSMSPDLKSAQPPDIILSRGPLGLPSAALGSASPGVEDPARLGNTSWDEKPTIGQEA
jgi:hypothetical protein